MMRALTQGRIRYLAAALFWALALPVHALADTPEPAPPGASSPDAVRSGYIDVENGRIFYEEAGSGEAIVLIHDGVVHREIWDGQFSAFAAGHRVVRYDRRGYGRSSTPEAPFSNLEDLDRLFEHLGIDKAILMGMSSGGGLAIDFTLEHPGKVSLLVLVGAVVSGFDYTDHFFTRGGHMTAADRSSPESQIEYWMMKDPYEIAPGNTAAKQRAKRLLEENPGNIDGTKHRFARRPERPALSRLHEISVPTLVLAGDLDIPDVHAHAGAISAGIPGAVRVVLPGAGHLAPLDRPSEFNDEVLRFMKEAKFMWILDTSGIDEAVKYFEESRRKDPAWTPMSEQRMNRLGYRYIVRERTGDAVEIFKLNVLAFPGSWNAFDSLGEGYMMNGDRGKAIESYRKSLELNPDNRNAVEKLKELEKE